MGPKGPDCRSGRTKTCASKSAASGPRASRDRSPGAAAVRGRPASPLRQWRAHTARPSGARHLGDPQEPGEDDKGRFGHTLVPIVDRLGQVLGLPTGCLRPEPHSVLVYAPGQFFVQHQDSEKDDSVVASLVVSLPPMFTGGALEVHHRSRIATYRGSKKALSFVAFYSDCRHPDQAGPLRSPGRVHLQLAATGSRQRRESPRTPSSPASSQVAFEEHFAAPDAPDRLVYLLGHEYTSRGLDWSRLKGTDVRSAGRLRVAAEQAGCEAALGLVDVHETWDALEVEARWGRSRYRGW